MTRRSILDSFNLGITKGSSGPLIYVSGRTRSVKDLQVHLILRHDPDLWVGTEKDGVGSYGRGCTWEYGELRLKTNQPIEGTERGWGKKEE